MSQADQLARICTLLETYALAMRTGQPAKARDAAYRVLQILNSLYADAYYAAMVQEHGKGKAL
jgi:hypothetical protein